MDYSEHFQHETAWPPPVAEAQPTTDGSVPTVEPTAVFPAHGGVYLLTDAADRLIQLSSSANLRRALQVRLGQPATAEPNATGPARPRADLRQIVARVRWCTAHSAFEINWRYWQIARVLLPGDYRKQLAFGPAWFVHVDPRAEHPRFVVNKYLLSPPGMDLGPFATQADAGRFVQIIEDAFDLCRYPHILEQAPRGQACAYYDMGKCPAPCDGSIPMERYRATIGEALAFAMGERAGYWAAWEGRMREAASAQAYERAAAMKQRIERIRSIEHEAFARVGSMAGFDYLVLQRGPGRRSVRPFYIRGGRIEVGADGKWKDLEQAANDWIAAARPERTASAADQSTDGTDASPTNDVEADRRAVSEQVWLVSHYLFRREPPGLFLRVGALPSAIELAGLAREAFGRKAGENEAEEVSA